MYLLSYFEDKAFFEASLGGKITNAEMEVFRDELLELICVREGAPFNLLLDYSRAKGFDTQSVMQLCEIRDLCLDAGAQKIVSVSPDEKMSEAEKAHRMTLVMTGREDFVLDPSYAQFSDVVSKDVYIARAA